MFTRPKLLLPLAALLLLAALPSRAFAGPGWMSLEYPANPHDPATRGAIATLRSYHHETPMSYTMRGVLEGRVGGRKMTRAVQVVATSTAGVYAVRGDVPEEGAWVLSVTLSGPNGAVVGTVLAALAPGGAIGRVEVPFDRTPDGWTVPREATPGELASLLAWSEAMGRLATDDTQAATPNAPSRGAIWALLLAPFAVTAGRRAWEMKRG